MTQPRFLGRYEVLDLIGQGGMGALYRARDPKIGRYVAIKLLRSAYDNSDVRERFAQEARAAGCLAHPNIVTIYDVGEHDGLPFIAMEYVRGQTFADLATQRPALPLAKTLQLVEDVCAGLAHAHQAGIVHRDIKPANLIVSADGIVKILDFGIAKFVAAGLTAPGTVLGTLLYMAPEQVKGIAVDARADIYSVGAVLYEMLAHVPAFQGSTYGEVLGRVLHGEPRPLDEVCPGIDPRLAQIVKTALERDPDRRFQDVIQLQRALAAIRLHAADAEPPPQVPRETGRRPPQPAGEPSGRARPPDDSSARLRADIERSLLLARRAFDAKDYESALGSCKQVLLLDPGDNRVLELIARINDAADEQRVQEQLAEAARQLAAGAFKAALQFVDNAAALAPAHADVESMRRSIAAEETRAIAAAVSTALARARSDYDRQQFDSALRHADRVLQLAPDHADARVLKQAVVAALERRAVEARAQAAVDRARVDFADGRHEAALSALRPLAADGHPLATSALAELEGAWREFEDRRRAEEERAARVRRAAVLVSEANAALSAGRLDDARRHADELQSIDRDGPATRALLDRLREAQAAAEREAAILAALEEWRGLLSRGDFDRGMERLRAAEALAPGDPRVQAAFKEHAKTVEAHALAERRREASLLLDEVERHLDAGALEEARERLARVAALLPDDARVTACSARVTELVARREAEAAAAARHEQAESLVRAAAERFEGAAGNDATGLRAALRDAKEALALEPEHAAALDLKVRIERELDVRKEAARVRTAIENARRRFENGKQVAAIRLLEEAGPDTHPEIAATLTELRVAWEAIESARRAEQERAARRARAMSLVSDARAALAARQFDEARRCAAEAASLQADVPDLAALEEAIRFAEDPAARQARMDALLADVGRSINRGEWEAADAFLQAAEAIDPADPRIRIGRSRVDPEIAKGPRTPVPANAPASPSRERVTGRSDAATRPVRDQSRAGSGEQRDERGPARAARASTDDNDRTIIMPRPALVATSPPKARSAFARPLLVGAVGVVAVLAALLAWWLRS
jgi:serine/threonine protein kinase